MTARTNTSSGRTKKEAQRQLQTDFTITPKTAGLLVRLGYHSYRDLRNVSPNQVAAQLKKLPGLNKGQIDAYRRALRRIVWLATQESPHEQAKVCSDWTNKSLKARGIWRDDFDNLTGDEVNEMCQKAISMDSEASSSS